jgi:hypothetical protein
MRNGFNAMHSDAIRIPRHLAAMHEFGRDWREADMPRASRECRSDATNRLGPQPRGGSCAVIRYPPVRNIEAFQKVV